MSDKLGGELKSDSQIDGLYSLFAIIFIAFAILNFVIPIRFWLTMLYWFIGLSALGIILSFSDSRNPWSKDLQIFQNEVIKFLPKNLGPMFCVYHTENSKLERIHDDDFVIIYQKELFNIFNFCLQEFVELLRNHKVDDVVVPFPVAEVEVLNQLGSAMANNISNASISFSIKTSPYKYSPPNYFTFDHGDFIYLNNIFEYIELKKEVTVDDYKNSLNYIIKFTEKWNKLHDCHYPNEDNIPINLDELYRTTYGNANKLPKKDNITGAYIIDEKLLDYAKQIDFEFFSNIIARVFEGCTLETIESTESFKNFNEALIKLKHFSNLEKLIEEDIFYLSDKDGNPEFSNKVYYDTETLDMSLNKKRESSSYLSRFRKKDNNKKIKNTNDSVNKNRPVSNCLRCGRDLEDTDSVNRGYGPICWEKRNSYY
jgi:hypothetical protein